MKVFQNHKILISILLLLLVVSITLFTINDTLTANVEHKYQSYTLDQNKTIFENLESIPEFSIFLSDALRTGIDLKLKDDSKTFVILLPNNEAYGNIDATNRAKLEDPIAMHKLEKIVSMHVFEVTNLSSFSTATEVRSINGQTIRMSLEDGETMIRDAVGNSFIFEKIFYPSSNGYFAKVTQVLLPFNISDVNGVQLEDDENIKENVENFAGADKFSEDQEKELEKDNVTFLYSSELTQESNIKDNIIQGIYNTYQLSTLDSVKTLSGIDLKITVDEDSINVGEITLDRDNSNLESKNGFIHMGL
jgi:uncharacterized surface protein with fasciclin (FAS1) repeats